MVMVAGVNRGAPGGLVTPGGLGANVIVIAADELEELAKVTSDPTATISLG
jgi:hypothetical protein